MSPSYVSGHTPSLRESRTETQGGNLETGAEPETTEEGCLLAPSSDLLSLYSYATQDELKGASSYSVVGSFILITNEEINDLIPTS